MLTRMEARSILGALTQHRSGLKLAGDVSELVWIPHDRFRVLSPLPMTFN
jgi:hypothetical protein